MKFEDRIPEQLFREDGHYLGRPADFSDRIITRRIRLVRNIPDFVGKEKTLLEIGCGNGASMILLSPDMESCTGIEVTEDHRDQFDKFTEEYEVDNCSYIIRDVVNDQATNQYDRLISFEVIEHLSNENGLRYYYDSLVDDGLMAITVPNKWWIFETHGAKLPLLPWNRVPFFSWLPRPIHERYANARIYTKNRITKLLERHGFEIMQVRYITAPMDVLPDGKLKDFVINNVFKEDTTSIPMKSTSIFVLARKIPGFVQK
jgi:2-polyprenyl-3-methyl-5-hydroxy-6-metoxy-1,4-benzoquinol methylase